MLQIVIGTALIIVGCAVAIGLVSNVVRDFRRAATNAILSTVVDLVIDKFAFSLLLPLILVGGGIALVVRGIARP